jgi:predicted  nucleic acid-binding Zn-ribbon protein
MLAAGLDEGVLGKYRRIMASKKDVAVVPVVHGTNCGGCHMKLTAGSAISAKAGNISATCENYGGLLFWPVD